MSKVASRLKGLKKAATDKVRHGTMRTNIPAGMAAAGPPLGPMLGQRNINIAAFCKEFNERTKDIKQGIPLPCRVSVNPDRSFTLTINKPPSVYYLKQAAGIQRGAMYQGKEVAGMVTLKHIYEIAKIKQEDPGLDVKPLEEICRYMIGTAKSCGIKVVRDLDAREYAEFLKERAVIVEQQKKELQEKKDAKMLRTGG